MGFFDKPRHGSMSVIGPRRYAWTIPDFMQASHGILDSANVPSITRGAEFHFHMTIAPMNPDGGGGEIGFYVHHKAVPIPKYSYQFRSQRSGRSMKQQTAHTIPTDTERCGHWNVCTRGDINELLCGPDDVLLVDFSFDDDTTTVTGSDDVQIEWRVPRVGARNLDPFCSAGFRVNGVLINVRLELKETAQGPTVFCYLFTRSPAPPSHSIALLSDGDFEIVAAFERIPEGSSEILRVPMETISRAVGVDGTIVVRAIVYKAANPLEFLNSAAARTGTAPKTVSLDKKGHKEGGNYAIINDDDV